ncbi:hypothetical protein ERN12_01135 [Rhodobacteraceae bacterium]|nr:hypothetical protein ERN12_01135 [Paracoccaceae bacterium]
MTATPPEAFQHATWRDKLSGLLLTLIIIMVILGNWATFAFAETAGMVLSVLVVALMTPHVKNSRKIFVAIALGLSYFAVITRPAPLELLGEGLSRAAFIIAFFCALATLRHVAGLSPAITHAASYLASQPPGRRYTALTIGAQSFALMLNYGAISLLGGMSRSSAANEPDPEIRAIRTRRMLQAVHRGFAATLCWSPLGFAMVISTSIVDGAEINAIILPALVSSAILVAAGWGMDRMFKPKLSQPRATSAPQKDAGHVSALGPIALLLVLIAVPVVVLDLTLGLSAAMSVLIVIPLLSAGWLVIGATRGERTRYLGRHAAEFSFMELPSFANEVVLLSMAGFIGSVAGAILAPLIAQSGLDLTALPAWVVLISPIVLIPLGGQLGMNPILFVSLFGPIMPTPEALGVSPTAVVMALTAGWAIAATTSPFTASVMLTARLGDVSPGTVSLKWNGLHSLVCAVLLSGWVLMWL